MPERKTCTHILTPYLAAVVLSPGYTVEPTLRTRKCRAPRLLSAFRPCLYALQCMLTSFCSIYYLSRDGPRTSLFANLAYQAVAFDLRKSRRIQSRLARLRSQPARMTFSPAYSCEGKAAICLSVREVDVGLAFGVGHVWPAGCTAHQLIPVRVLYKSAISVCSKAAFSSETPTPLRSSTSTPLKHFQLS